ncbi:putative O-methyltransferase [Echria macrotheca]|uniref:O-methyltransferase n=1 Tax=Echria macrotheca TaxID=438768 RepID=A0AAJ0B413_9PEZI|nr:putative O-methyltransferase [Echria macrotheca]
MADTKSRLKQSYDAIAERYTDWAVKNSALRIKYLDRLLSLLPPTANNSGPLKALELGCGAGVPVTQTLLASPGGRKFSVVANDLSDSQLALGRAKLGEGPNVGVEWLQGDMNSLEFAEGSFDVVIALYSIIHLPRDEQPEMLRKVAKWLKPGGLVLVNFGIEEVEAEETEDWLGAWMVWSGWGVEGSMGKVKETGLEVVVEEVSPGDGVDASFLWVIARKSVDG